MYTGMGEQYQVSDDAIQTGILEVLGCRVTPFRDGQGKVWFRIEGDHQQALSDIFANKSVGALDALKAIKALRQAIFALKGNGNGRRDGRHITR
jgi:hypothetical protein